LRLGLRCGSASSQKSSAITPVSERRDEHNGEQLKRLLRAGKAALLSKCLKANNDYLTLDKDFTHVTTLQSAQPGSQAAQTAFGQVVADVAAAPISLGTRIAYAYFSNGDWMEWDGPG
jgi:hypothetical protein